MATSCMLTKRATSIVWPNTEGHFRQLLYVVISLIGCYLLTEVRTAIGCIDVVLAVAHGCLCL